MVFSKSMEDHVDHLRQVFYVLSQHGLKLKIQKCFFAKPKVRLLGHLVDKNGVSVDPSKVRAIMAVQTPKTSTELRSFSDLPVITGASSGILQQLHLHCMREPPGLVSSSGRRKWKRHLET